MYVTPGTSFDLIRRLSLESLQVADFLSGFLPYLPDNLDDNLRGLLKEGLGKILQDGVKQPASEINYEPLLQVLTSINPNELRIRYATQKGISPALKREMDTIANRWENLLRRTRAAHALICNMKKESIHPAELGRRLDVSRGYLMFLLTLRRAVTSPELAARIEELTNLDREDFVSLQARKYNRSRPSRNELIQLLDRRKVRKIVADMRELSEADLDVVGQVVKSLATKRT